MPASSAFTRARRFALAPLALALLCSPLAASSQLDSAAERALGPGWQHLAKSAGMIFSGSVLSVGPPTQSGIASQERPTHISRIANDSSASPGPRVSSIEIRFRVDRPISGVTRGQTLTIHEWIGAIDRQPPLHPGDRVLLFLYPPSRLGLTSPVDGPQGQIRLDSSGQYVASSATLASPQRTSAQESSTSSNSALIPISQLERAVRTAQGERK